MSSVEQKAKTFLDLQIAYREIFDREPRSEADKIARIASLNLFENTHLVRLSVAQQEINRHITLIADLGKSLREMQSDYENLRQGIINIHNTLKNSPLGDSGDKDGLYYISIKEWAPIMGMFDKILNRSYPKNLERERGEQKQKQR